MERLEQGFNLFTIEGQYQFYLKLNKLSEDTMFPQQKKEVRRAFFGAVTMFFLVLRDDVGKLSDQDAFTVMDGFEDQIKEFVKIPKTE